MRQQNVASVTVIFLFDASWTTSCLLFLASIRRFCKSTNSNSKHIYITTFQETFVHIYLKTCWGIKSRIKGFQENDKKKRLLVTYTTYSVEKIDVARCPCWQECDKNPNWPCYYFSFFFFFFFLSLSFWSWNLCDTCEAKKLLLPPRLYIYYFITGWQQTLIVKSRWIWQEHNAFLVLLFIWWLSIQDKWSIGSIKKKKKRVTLKLVFYIYFFKLSTIIDCQNFPINSVIFIN